LKFENCCRQEGSCCAAVPGPWVSDTKMQQRKGEKDGGFQSSKNAEKRKTEKNEKGGRLVKKGDSGT